MKMDSFKKRLREFYGNLCDAEMLEKYEGMYEFVLDSEKKTDEELLPLVKQIDMAGYTVRSSKPGEARLILNQDDRAFSRAHFSLLGGIDLSEDIISFGVAIPQKVTSSWINPKYVWEVAKIDVYSRGILTDSGFHAPNLTKRQVLAQIPAEFHGKVHVFALDLKEKLPFDNYNLLMGMYSFRVVLYSLNV